MNSITVTSTAVVDALRAVGIGKGDVAFVHSDAIIAAQFPMLPLEQRLEMLINAIGEVLGSEGTLIMPTFSYSFTSQRPFDIARTPSVVGMITEYFRKRAGVCRSGDPIFSIAAQGTLAEQFCSMQSQECFGPESAFALFHRMNGWIVCLGCSLSRSTFVHYIERMYGVGYRYNKDFSGIVIDSGGVSTQRTVTYFVRDLSRRTEVNLGRLRQNLQALDKLKTSAVGRVGISAVRALDFVTTACEMLDQDPLSLIEEGTQTTHSDGLP